MADWTSDLCKEVVYELASFDVNEQACILAYLQKNIPYGVYQTHVAFRALALENNRVQKQLVANATIEYPSLVFPDQQAVRAMASGYGIVLTAGGDGERLRDSLLQSGARAHDLKTFTKATWPLAGLYKDYGALQVNLTLIATLAKKYDLDIPVVVTVGPASSVTARVIPEILAKHKNFGVKNLRIVLQKERLHLTLENQIVFRKHEDGCVPVTHPDETGGPFMAFLDGADQGTDVLSWLRKCGCKKIIALQATALYDPMLIPILAEAGMSYDCVGAGIMRSEFPHTDPYGTFALIKNNAGARLMIIEQEMRSLALYACKDPTRTYHLPYNTGLYVFDLSLLTTPLPDYATPPKEILPNIPKAPKAGYAATDIVGVGKHPAVVAVDHTRFAVIKNANDLTKLTSVGRAFGLDILCKEMAGG